VSWRVETAARHRQNSQADKAKPTPYTDSTKPKRTAKGVVEYEPDLIRDTEQVPLLEPGGIEAFIRREVLPYSPDAWVDESAAKIGYEISFTRHFYKPQPLRTLAEISADIRALEQETEGLLTEITKGAN
jgi:type I restriction enzyme M protein